MLNLFVAPYRLLQLHFPGILRCILSNLLRSNLDMWAEAEAQAKAMESCMMNE